MSKIIFSEDVLKKYNIDPKAFEEKNPYDEWKLEDLYKESKRICDEHEKYISGLKTTKEFLSKEAQDYMEDYRKKALLIVKAMNKKVN